MSFLVDMSQFTMQFSNIGHLDGLGAVIFPAVIAEKVIHIFVTYSFLLLLDSLLRLSFRNEMIRNVL